MTKPEDIYWSPKIDGIRTRIIVDKRTIKDKSEFRKIADIKYLSINYKEIPNFKIFDKDIIEICHILNKEYGIKYPIKLDAEASSESKKLSHVMTQFRRIETADPSIFRLNIFDIVINNTPFIKRHNFVKKAIEKVKSKNILLLPYELFHNFSTDRLDDLVNKMSKFGYEGVILQNSNAEYIYGDTYYAVKAKKVETVDLKIIGINLGKEDSRLKGKLATFICEYKGKPLNVSGRLDDKDRDEFAKNPPIGKIAEVQFQEETPEGSLRNPIFIRLREDKFLRETIEPNYPDVTPNHKIDGKFLIHKHEAKKAGLHYDLRLGHNGVLKSWACRKISDLIDDEAKRIMVFETPDHDSSWFNFEGEIEDGYGAGKVTVWDKGTFKETYWSKDHITVIFNGTKLKGKYTFILYQNGTQKQWLFFKSK